MEIITLIGKFPNQTPILTSIRAPSQITHGKINKEANTLTILKTSLVLKFF